MQRSDEGLDLRGLRKSFGAQAALRGIDLAADPGEVVGVTGPSGAGKTTIARIIAGLEQADSGEVRLTGRSIADLPPQARNVALMFESYALYPHMTVEENLLFPTRSPRARRRFAPAAAREAMRGLLDLVEMAALAGRYPGELSGGQKQRVALCRLLIQEPDIRLLDEPISHLDSKLRHKLRSEIRRRLAAGTAPALWFTPDAMEALAVGSRVAVVIGGRVQQFATPAEINECPANIAVAKLIGDPPLNLLRGRLERRADALWFCHAAIEVALEGALRRAAEASAGPGEIVLGVRPSALALGGTADTAAEIDTVEPLGKFSIITIRLAEDFVKIRTEMSSAWRSGDRLAVALRTDRLVLFDAATGDALPATEAPLPLQRAGVH